MRLYYHPLSSIRAVLLPSTHLGLDLEKLRVDLSGGAQKAPEYVRRPIPAARCRCWSTARWISGDPCAIMQYPGPMLGGRDIYPAPSGLRRAPTSIAGCSGRRRVSRRRSRRSSGSACRNASSPAPARRTLPNRTRRSGTAGDVCCRRASRAKRLARAAELTLADYARRAADTFGCGAKFHSATTRTFSHGSRASRASKPGWRQIP